MAKARLMNTPDDYARLGVNPERIEVWEDGRRSTPEKGTWEWWYFDAILDDSTHIVIQFFTKSGTHMNSGSDHPKFKIRVTLPDGTEYSQGRDFSAKKCSWSREMCDVRYGNNHFTGNLRDYSVYLEPLKGIGADLNLHSQSSPYRPGSAYFEFGTPGKYYTWFCAVPRGELTGTLTLDGTERSIHGYAYHDHQWGNVTFLKEWNHWIWARQSFDDCSMLVFDMVSTESSEYTRFPIVFVQDTDGNLLYESLDNVHCDILSEYYDEVSEKTCPKEIHYIFENDGIRAEYKLEMQSIIENNGKNNLPSAQRLIAKALKLNASYTRYDGIGTLTLTDSNRHVSTVRSGELIYEFMYPGSNYHNHM